MVCEHREMITPHGFLENQLFLIKVFPIFGRTTSEIDQKCTYQESMFEFNKIFEKFYILHF